MKIIKTALAILCFGAIILAACYTIVWRFIDPSLTETQLLIKTWPAWLPGLVIGVVYIVITKIEERRE